MNAVTTTDHEEAPRLPSLQSGGQVRAIVPQDFDGAWRIANAVAKAGMAPKGLETPEKAMVAIMHGMEVGMTPMAALQSIAVVNGRPTIWGDGAIGLVRSSGKLEWIKETITGADDSMVATCEVKRKGDPDPVKATFSVADAKKAGLWGKQGPWQQYPKRMLAMCPRFRSARHLRRHFAWPRHCRGGQRLPAHARRDAGRACAAQAARSAAGQRRARRAPERGSHRSV
jgi:hypothetical protein